MPERRRETIKTSWIKEKSAHCVRMVRLLDAHADVDEIVDALQDIAKTTASGPLRRMQAEVLFLDPAHLNDALSKFTKYGFEAVYLPERIDECGPAVIIQVTLLTRASDDEFVCGVAAIVGLISKGRGGDIVEWGEDR